jgi:serine/threonine protein kinase
MLLCRPSGSAISSSGTVAMIGQVIDEKYCVVRRIGQGSMGTVYEASAVRTGRRVALKLIDPDLSKENPEILQRFEVEAKALAALDTPHVIRVFDADVERSSGQRYLVMELVTGADFEQIIEKRAPLPADVVLRVAAQTLAGLRALHHSNITHRDIKPANIYLARRDDGTAVVKILDFGVAKVTPALSGKSPEQAMTRTGTIIGSPSFMSPEQAQGLKTIDHRTDIWSLGAVMYEALSGRTLHHDVTGLGELMIAISTQPPRPLAEIAPWVPREVAEIVHRALTIDVTKRFSTATEMLDRVLFLLPTGSHINEWMLAPIPSNERTGDLALQRRSLTPNTPVDLPTPDRVPVSRAPISLGKTLDYSTPSQKVPALSRRISSRPPDPLGATVNFSNTPPEPSMARWPVTRSLPPARPSPTAESDFRREFREFGGWLVSVCRATHLVPVLVGMAVLGSCFIGVWAAVHAPRSAPQRVPAVVVKGPAPIEPMWGLSQQKPTCAANESRHVSVAIGKRARTVLVDGARAELRHGFVDIDGVLGSVHVVRVDDAPETEVAITLHGALPTKVGF